MIKMETKILIKDVIISENGHLDFFWKVKIHKYFSICISLSLIQVFSLNVFYNVLEKMYNT
jgi:hypothetical protein